MIATPSIVNFIISTFISVSLPSAATVSARPIYSTAGLLDGE